MCVCVCVCVWCVYVCVVFNCKFFLFFNNTWWTLPSPQCLLHRKNVVYFVITESYTCSIYTSVPKTAEAMFYYQCTIIIFIASTKKSQNSNFIKRFIIYDTPHIIRLRTLSHNRQEEYWRLQQIIRSVLVIHTNCSGRAKPDIISTWWAFYFTMSGYEWPKGVDHFGECFVRVRPVNRLSSCKYRTFGQTFGLSTYFPSSLAFYFAMILTTRRSLCTLQLYHLQDGDRDVCFQHGGVATNVTSGS